MKHLLYLYMSTLLLATVLFSCDGIIDSLTKESTKVEAKDSPTTYIAYSASLWEIDTTASKVDFSIKNMGIDVKGHLGGLNGTISFDDKNPEISTVEGFVKVATINTGIAKRDRDLQEKKFFNSEKFKFIVFKSSSITRVGNSYKAAGTLTIKETSKQVEIPFTFEQKGNKGVIKSNFTLNRRDYDVGGNEVVMADELKVSLVIIVKKKQATTQTSSLK